MLSLILDMAVKDGRLARNVASGVNLPRLVKPEHLYLTHDQVEDLARECGFPSDPSRHATYDTRSNETYRLVVLFLAYTGRAVRRDGGAPRQAPRPAASSREDRRVSHPGSRDGHGLGNTQDS